MIWLDLLELLSATIMHDEFNCKHEHKSWTEYKNIWDEDFLLQISQSVTQYLDQEKFLILFWIVFYSPGNIPFWIIDSFVKWKSWDLVPEDGSV